MALEVCAAQPGRARPLAHVRAVDLGHDDTAIAHRHLAIRVEGVGAHVCAAIETTSDRIEMSDFRKDRNCLKGGNGKKRIFLRCGKSEKCVVERGYLALVVF